MIEDAAKAKRSLDRIEARIAQREQLVKSQQDLIKAPVTTTPTGPDEANESATRVKTIAGVLRTTVEGLR